MKVLITGGAGFIGSTIATACAEAGIDVVILDDLSTGRRAFAEGYAFYEGDIADGALIDRVTHEHPDLSILVHCAAKIVVPESVADPLDYYSANVGKSIELFRHLRRNGLEKVLFSSSASVYAAPDGGAVSELSELAPSSPYARTKAMVEQVLSDSAEGGQLRAIALRYFNPIGADPQLRTGLQNLEPSHALGVIMRAHAAGVAFTITGADWPTRDGSGLRDFVHVWDLALAHVRALQRFDDVTADAAYRVINVGGGQGTTVRELVAAFERVTGDRLEVREGPRRPGDVAGGYADASLASELLDWHATKTTEDGIRDALSWSKKLADLD